MAAKESTGTSKANATAAPKAEADAPPRGAGAAEQAAAKGAESGMAAARAMADSTAAAARRWPADPFRFMTHRLDRQIEHMGALMACRSPGEVFELETRFTLESMRDYMDETNRLFQNAAQVGADLLASLQESPRRHG